MELRPVLKTVFILAYLSHSQGFSVNYQGKENYPIGTDAILTCNYQPIPDNTDYITVAWYKTVQTESRKIGVSSSRVNGSFIYRSAPADIKERFTMSHARFATGLADATILNTTIGDDSSYECEVEDIHSQETARITFTVGVYSFPTVYIEDVEVNLDIRPVKENAPETNEMENSTMEPTTTPEATPTPLPEDDKVTVAKCYAVNAYPEPIRLEFTSSGSGNLWIVEQADFLSRTQNPDGTFDVSARLRIQPTPELDGDTISCSSVIIDSNYRTHSINSTSQITVRHPTSYTRISILPSTVNDRQVVTVTCRSDGNPASTMTLTTPSGDTIDVTNGEHKFVADRNKQGTYTCSAFNDVDAEAVTDSKQLVVNWMDDPVVTGQGSGILGGSATFDCNVQTNYLNLRYQWTKHGEIIETSPKLVRRDLTYDDAGVYVCDVTGFEKRSASTNFEVEGGCQAKISTIVASSQTKEGEAYVKVRCEAQGVPACNMKLSPYLDVTPIDDIKDDNLIELVIKAVPMQMNPLKFSCMATNIHGKSNVSTVLDERYAEVCCSAPATAGLGTGTIIIIILIVALVIVGIPLAVYLIKKRNAKKPSGSGKDEKSVELAESDKLNQPEENDV